jgi:lysozyme family protein
LDVLNEGLVAAYKHCKDNMKEFSNYIIHQMLRNACQWSLAPDLLIEELFNGISTIRRSNNTRMSIKEYESGGGTLYEELAKAKEETMFWKKKAHRALIDLELKRLDEDDKDTQQIEELKKQYEAKISKVKMERDEALEKVKVITKQLKDMENKIDLSSSPSSIKSLDESKLREDKLLKLVEKLEGQLQVQQSDLEEQKKVIQQTAKQMEFHQQLV